MSKVNIFEQATRQGLRFNTNRGMFSVEDLWTLPLTGNNGFNLDTLAIGLYKNNQDAVKIQSFVSQKSLTNPEDELRFEIIKHIIDVRLKEAEKAMQAKEQADKKQKILSVIYRKKDMALEEASMEELKKMLKEL